MTKENIRFFQLARKSASLSDYDRINIGCVATYKGKVISNGFNMQKTHPKQMLYNTYRTLYESANLKHYIHAEMMCLNKISSDVDTSKVVLYVYRDKKDHTLGMSRPCPACMKRIKEMGIRKVFYTTDDGLVEENLLKSKY